MGGLAKWVMKKRLNAIIGVMVFGLIPMMFWLAAAILGLVVLRKGVKEGIPVLAWGCLPALVLWMFQGDATALMVLVDVMLLSYLLRSTMSWSWVLLVGSFLAVISTLLQPLLMADILNLAVTLVQSVLTKEGVEVPDRNLIFNQAVMAISIFQVVIAIISLFLARKWQAGLYNPGGLRTEFHQLRLPVVFSLVLGGMILIGESLGGSFSILSQAAVPALVLPGLALVHGVLAKKEIGIVGLIAFYLVGFFVLNVYFANILVALCVIDSFVDIRSRIQGKASNSSDS
ncbi:MAG: hypothetical protein KJ609_04840 [Gammaproteobacteria bacterium]|jgi:hypothetical protein|uniref:hypothetical protein n=1 Tax=Marinomonas TaxID=28253 RepID=UPI000C1F4059|nr:MULTISPECIES: hypothetical protein [unclassified Marinomonas]MBU1294026.1 hypothetical protein [Gammaproteobacteria bacterium]MBU1468334.1 hypothetical protein [Gammaproteobacteria bacterium]MBU2317857.1 hypothetical protein [Gammaproteobacteria bacterium]MBU2414019.1 hypothetical protein [Gammaproteobacteria bacterium]PJE54361.1 hypothetical protein TY87_16345 [Marinomonas sp. BSi20584]